MIKQITLVAAVAIGLLLIPGTNVGTNAHEQRPHRHGTTLYGIITAVGIAITSAIKFIQHKLNP